MGCQGDWCQDCFQDSPECKVYLVKPQVGVIISYLCVCVILRDPFSFLYFYLLVVLPPKTNDWWQTYRGRRDKNKGERMWREEVRIFSIILS